jgi:hypothetical protein
MATSGSTDFSLNARAVIKYAFEKLHVYPPEQDPSAADMENGLLELNLLLKGWQRKAPSLFRRSTISVPLVANTTAYTLSPRPYRVISARYRNASAYDLPMFEWTAEDYEAMPVKTATGTPVAFYVDYQRDSVVLNIWQCLASVSTETVRVTVQRRFEDIDALENDLDIPQESLDLVGYSLADRLAAQFGKSGSPIHAEVKGQAMFLMQELLSDDREDVVRFVPDNL